jgi:hypothetical protein
LEQWVSEMVQRCGRSWGRGVLEIGLSASVWHMGLGRIVYTFFLSLGTLLDANRYRSDICLQADLNKQIGISSDSEMDRCVGENRLWPYRKFNSAPGCICSLYPKKIFLNVNKIWPNIMHLYIHNLSAIVKFHQKLILFMVYLEKTKIVMWNVLFLASKFIFFTLATRHIDLSWNDFVGM